MQIAFERPELRGRPESAPGPRSRTTIRPRLIGSPNSETWVVGPNLAHGLQLHRHCRTTDHPRLKADVVAVDGFASDAEQQIDDGGTVGGRGVVGQREQERQTRRRAPRRKALSDFYSAAQRQDDVYAG
ncbi:hypothetical protein OOK36_53985 [Streptomyces sp. NBC_00365]|uniref:hypothetical protein n=1 Tax=Streptomyces sp. NBC_00365 TaxID=2975726 RepID=UPI0022595960|nr:hypothetical protein [Streptomyces sp. NBC_00365]MCX5097401.1 hypothetical protein [Streptomyces sp. NBC_00365]